jgi:WD40 repeat protein
LAGAGSPFEEVRWPMSLRFKHAVFRVAVALTSSVLLALATPVRAAEGPYLELDTKGHMALIRSLVFTRDGSELISASDDKTIRVWDTDTGRLKRAIRGEIGEGDPGKVYAVALSRDGRLLAAAGALGEGNPIRLYDFASGQLIGLLKGHNDAVLSLDFSPDGSELVSGSVDNTAIIWDVKQRTQVARLKGHTGDVNAARFTHDGSAVVTASDDDTIKLWRASDGALLDTLTGHTDKVVALAVSLRDGALASGALDGTIKIWDLHERRMVKEIAQGTEVMSLAFSPDGTLLLSGVGRTPYDCHVWNVATGNEVASYSGHDNIVLATAVAPDGVTAATAGGDNNEIHLWNLRDGKLEHALVGVGHPVWSVGFFPDGRSIAWGIEKVEGSPAELGPLGFTLKLPTEDSPTGEPKPLHGSIGKFVQAVTAMNGLELKTRASGEFGYLDLLDVVKDGEILATIKRGEKAGYAHNAYTFSPDGKTVISGGGHGFLTAYDLRGDKLGEFVGHTSDVWAVAVSPDGRFLLSGSDDQTVRLWNMATRENIVSLFSGRNGEWVLWTPQGYYAASPLGDAHVGWHVNEGERDISPALSAQASSSSISIAQTS